MTLERRKMILLTKVKEKSEEALLVAENKEDLKVLHYLYDKHILFGAYKMYDKLNDKSRTSNEAKFLATHFPLSDGMLFVNVVEGYAR